MAASVVISKDEKRVPLGLLYWNPETNQLDIEGPEYMDTEELVAMLHLFDLKKVECPKHG